MIDINKVLETYILNGVTRYSNRHRIKDESVAEHSFHTALLAYRICKDIGCDEHIAYRIVTKALIHDIEESLFGDIPYNAKARFPSLRLELKRHENQMMNEDFSELLINDNYEEYAEFENDVVKLADILSVVQYCYTEYTLGNQQFLSMYNDACKRYMLQRNWIIEKHNVVIATFDGEDMMYKMIENTED